MKNLNACLASLNLGLPDDVRRLKEAGYYTEAIARIDAYLAEDWTKTQNQPVQPGGPLPENPTPHGVDAKIRLYGSPVPDVTTVTFFPESFLSSLLDSELAFLSESSDLALLPHPATVPTVIIVTNKAANTRFFIILNLLFVI